MPYSPCNIYLFFEFFQSKYHTVQCTQYVSSTKESYLFLEWSVYGAGLHQLPHAPGARQVAGQPARTESQPARTESQPARTESQPARTEPAHGAERTRPTAHQPARTGADAGHLTRQPHIRQTRGGQKSSSPFPLKKRFKIIYGKKILFFLASIYTHNISKTHF